MNTEVAISATAQLVLASICALLPPAMWCQPQAAVPVNSDIHIYAVYGNEPLLPVASSSVSLSLLGTGFSASDTVGIRCPPGDPTGQIAMISTLSSIPHRKTLTAPLPHAGSCGVTVQGQNGVSDEFTFRVVSCSQPSCPSRSRLILEAETAANAALFKTTSRSWSSGGQVVILEAGDTLRFGASALRPGSYTAFARFACLGEQVSFSIGSDLTVANVATCATDSQALVSGPFGGIANNDGVLELSVTVSQGQVQLDFVDLIEVVDVTNTPDISIVISGDLGGARLQTEVFVESSRVLFSDLAGVLEVESFVPSTGLRLDPAILFENGTSAIEFVIPANQTRSVFPAGPSVRLQTGTVSGAIHLRAIGQVGGVDQVVTSEQTVDVPALPPAFDVEVLGGEATSIQVAAVGFSNLLEVNQATVRALPRNLTIYSPFESSLEPGIFTDWFTSRVSQDYGGLFRLVVEIKAVSPFDLRRDLQSVTIILGSRAGTTSKTVEMPLP